MSTIPKPMTYIEQLFRLSPGDLLNRGVNNSAKRKAQRVLVWYYREKLRLSLREIELLTGISAPNCSKAVSAVNSLARTNPRYTTITEHLWKY